MVRLDFKIVVPLTLQDCWEYYSDFRTIPQWDPNVIACNMIKDNSKNNNKGQKIGNVYDVTVIFGKNKSKVAYEVIQYVHEERIRLTAQNSIMTFDENISFRFKKHQFTIVEYISHIQLKGPLCILMPCLKGSLMEAGDRVKEKMLNRGKEVAQEKRCKLQKNDFLISR